MKRTGIISIIGRANVGKSSLVNAMTGMRVSIVSPKPQTTRHRIYGILTEGDFQMIFADTPGIHTAKNTLDKFMGKEIGGAIRDACALVLVIDAERGITEYDLQLAEKYKDVEIPFVAVLNKTDRVKAHILYPQIARLNDLKIFKDIFFTSARKGENIALLKEELKKYLPEGEFLYEPDDYTDKSIRFMITETIREKALLFLQEEIPHGITVTIEEADFAAKIPKISALIICEKQNHKKIIIGKEGAMLKKIGESARRGIEELLSAQVFLALHVKVVDDWRTASVEKLNDLIEK